MDGTPNEESRDGHPPDEGGSDGHPPGDASRDGASREAAPPDADPPPADSRERDPPAADPPDEGSRERDGMDGVFGSRPDEVSDDVLPGEPEPENVAFVLLGVGASLLVVADLVGFL